MQQREPITLSRLPAVQRCTLFDLMRDKPLTPDSWLLHYVVTQDSWPVAASARLWRPGSGQQSGVWRVRLVRIGRVDETIVLSDPLEVAAFLGLEGDMAATKPWQRCQE